MDDETTTVSDSTVDSTPIDVSWDTSGGATQINTGDLLPGQEGYGWKYYSDGTAISPTGAPAILKFKQLFD